MGKLATMDNNKMPNKRSWQQAIAEWAQRNAKYIAMFGTACLLSVAACNNGGEKVKGEEAGVEQVAPRSKGHNTYDGLIREFQDICEFYGCSREETEVHVKEGIERVKKSEKAEGYIDNYTLNIWQRDAHKEIYNK